MNTLLVGTDGKFLSLIQRMFRGKALCRIALDCRTALQILEEDTIAVLFVFCELADQDSIEFLEQIAGEKPDVIRVLLVENTCSQENLIRAVNQGAVFRILPRNASEEEYLTVLDAAQKARVQNLQREEVYSNFARTMHELISWLRDDVQEITAPVLPLLRALSLRLGVASPALTETAFLFSVLGLISLPTELLKHITEGKLLSEEERVEFGQHPLRALDFLQHAPEVQNTERILKQYTKILQFCLLPGSFACNKDFRDFSPEVLLLALTMEYRLALYVSTEREEVFDALEASPACYPSEYLKVLREESVSGAERLLPLSALLPGMITAGPIIGQRAGRELVLVPAGYELSHITTVFLHQAERHTQLPEMVAVRELSLPEDTDNV